MNQKLCSSNPTWFDFRWRNKRDKQLEQFAEYLLPLSPTVRLLVTINKNALCRLSQCPFYLDDCESATIQQRLAKSLLVTKDDLTIEQLLELIQSAKYSEYYTPHEQDVLFHQVVTLLKLMPDQEQMKLLQQYTEEMPPARLLLLFQLVTAAGMDETVPSAVRALIRLVQRCSFSKDVENLNEFHAQALNDVFLMLQDLYKTATSKEQ